MDAATEFLIRFPSAVRFEDVIDVALATAFFFIIITWLRQEGRTGTPRRVVLLGVPLVVTLFLADRYDLALVESVMRLVGLVLLVTLIVIFQSDLRRMLDRMAATSDKARRLSRDTGTVENLVSAVTAMPRSQAGALIAIRGAERWDAFVEGGIELDGLVSKPAILSIFSPDTPGHDGAMLIEGDRVTWFGVHLPLSRQPLEITRAGGTRHAAALGLAESCDALVIAVSEESGRVSVARDGEIHPVRDAHELRATVSEFWDRHYRYRPAAERRTRVWTAGGRVGLAFVLALSAWLLFVFRTGTTQRTYDVPITFRNVPPEWVIETETLASARLVLVGPEHFFRAIDASRLAVSFDMSDPRPGASVLPIGAENLNAPPELRIAYVDPATVPVVAHRFVSVLVPLVVTANGDQAGSITATADRGAVRLLIPEDGERPVRVTTVPVDPDTDRPTVVDLLLVVPEGARLAPGERARVRVRIEARRDETG